MNKIIFGQDTEIIPSSIINDFKLKDGIDMKYDRISKSYVYDFVGFVICKESVLVVFPKHYFGNDHYQTSVQNCSIEEAKILFKTIIKYSSLKSKHNSSEKFYGEKRNFESDFPFASFFTIYNYFLKYGLYHEEKKEIAKSGTGSINWKKTIQKSNIIISDGNLVFEPLYVTRKQFNNNLISDSMIYAINKSLEIFPFFENINLINHKIENEQVFENLNFVIKCLEISKREIFRDSQKKLISALIEFFKNEEKARRGGKKVIKITYFNMIWQSMINEYLNRHFISFDEVTHKIEFDENRKKGTLEFSPKSFLIDNSSHQFSINLDHYAISDSAQYIFDSKYYYDINELNYKQFTYNIVMGNSKTHKRDKLISCLLLPGKPNSSLNLDLKENFQINNQKHQIVEQYLPPKDIMIDYIKNR